MANRLRGSLITASILGGAALSVPALAASEFSNIIKSMFGIGNLNKEYAYPKCGTQEVLGVNPQTGEKITAPYPCGAVVYVNAGGYVVKSVKLSARGPNHQISQDPTYKADCEAISKSLDADVSLGKYDSFIVPASCAYQLSIKISGGDSKDKNVFLTPGCIVKLKSDGTTTVSNWQNVTTQWTPEGQQAYQTAIDNGVASKTSVPKNPEDLDGHKCGQQNDM